MLSLNFTRKFVVLLYSLVLFLFFPNLLFAKPVEVSESWGYVTMKYPEEYSNDYPLTDVCFFAADINCYGELVDVPKRSSIDVKNRRAHFVLICDSKSLTHFVISPEFGLREKIINDIALACADFDGLQLDLELVPARDEEVFLSFLYDMRTAVPDKIFSVCVPARTKRLRDDVYHYEEISKLCDRVFVMAYDEHWSGGVPGPVASVSWCKNVAKYATKTIPQEKLVMGIPFYGRTWKVSDTPVDGAWYYNTIFRRLGENDIDYTIKYQNDIPVITYTGKVSVTGYLNDARSVLALARLYKKSGIDKIGYWRLGQEDPAVWQEIIIRR